MSSNEPKKPAPTAEPSKPQRRDSTLYRGLANNSREAADSAANVDEKNIRFVLSSDEPELVPVDHRAVIEELTASLGEIDAQRHKLEAALAGKNQASKLQIAQIKGRLAELKRRKAEVENLLRSRGESN